MSCAPKASLYRSLLNLLCGYSPSFTFHLHFEEEAEFYPTINLWTAYGGCGSRGRLGRD